MSVHRLLQRGFARLYQYKIEALNKDEAADSELVDFSRTAIHCESSRELNYKMKGARF